MKCKKKQNCRVTTTVFFVTFQAFEHEFDIARIKFLTINESGQFSAVQIFPGLYSFIYPDLSAYGSV